MMLSLFILPVSAQDQKICIGTKAMYKANGLQGSTYNYKLEQPYAGTIFREYPDTIVVEWGSNKGVFQLGVQEISQYGCEGNWAYMNVEIVGDYAQFTQPIYSLCGGEGVMVEFNKSPFQAYEWVDPTVARNDGYITKPGRYELKTFDHNGCLLSSFIEVVQNPTPKIELGADTMICTPGFTLHAYDIQDNPDGTVYTWSTGESGTSFRSITIENHNSRDNSKYWVNADLNGCSVSDTIVVLACWEEPLPENLNIPNTFTPNADGDNDTWIISALMDYPECIIEVFDRWGRKVFTSSRGYTSSPWDGLDARGHYLPMETYYYIIHLNDGKAKKPLLGTITIIR